MQQLLPPPGAEVARGPEPDLDLLYATSARPTTRLGLVVSVDGRSSVGGLSQGLSTGADRTVFSLLRSLADVVLVGAGTARAEGYLPVKVSPERQRLRLARGQRPTPVVAVVTRGAGLPAGHALRAAAAGSLLIHLGDDPLPGQPGLEVLAVPDLAAGLSALHGRGLTQVLCEGGPALAASLVDAGLVGELCLTTSPLVVGGDGPTLLAGLRPGSRPVRLAHLLHDEGTLLARWVLGAAGPARP